jgi:hypothetical protein
MSLSIRLPGLTSRHRSAPKRGHRVPADPALGFASFRVAGIAMMHSHGLVPVRIISLRPGPTSQSLPAPVRSWV